jgi:hypothetical protein
VPVSVLLTRATKKAARKSRTRLFLPPVRGMNQHENAVARAALPELMFIPDVAVALCVGKPAARRLVLRGDCGPYIRVGRRLAVLRESFLQALESRQELPGPRMLRDGNDEGA